MGFLEPHGRYRWGDGGTYLIGVGSPRPELKREDCMAAFRTLDDIGDVRGKRVLVRVDLNVPMQDGSVSDATRLLAMAPTVNELADKGAIVLLLSHFGRPKGAKNPSQSLSLVIDAVEDVLGRSVMFVSDCAGEGAIAGLTVLAPGDVAVMENTRFHPGEEKNDPALVAAMAELGDLYVNDAFSAAHRAHASTEGLAHVLPAFAGRAMEAELKALDAALGNPARPVVAIVGGAKVSSKIDVLRHLVGQVDHLVIGGGMANTFLAARGIDVGKSLCEHDLVDTANAIFDGADKGGCTIHLPYDVVVAKEFRANPPVRTVNVHEVAADEMILDVGPSAVEALSDVLKNCRTLVWNGPLGAFETPPFDIATVALARTAAALTREGSLVSVAGGGDTVAALNQADAAGDFTFVSTAGGAFLEWMEGRELPGVAALLQ
jgi:phosphoglycerate kinase